MTELDPALSRLAGLAGVATRYADAWGMEKHVSAEALRAILSAMGVAAAAPQEVADSAMLLEAEAWRALLPPVAVIRAGDAGASVALTVPERLAAGRASCSVACEDGSAKERTVDLASLVVTSGYGGHRRLALPPGDALPLGYHRLRVEIGSESAETVLIVTPARCALLPGSAAGKRAWGLTTQLYGVRSARNWGMGDFSDLAALGEIVAARGAQVLGVNPLHALFPPAPRHISPYSPSTRLFLNPFYIDIEAVPDFADSIAAQARLGAPEASAMRARAQNSDEIDHSLIAALKTPLFEDLYRSFAARHLEAGPEGAKTDRGRAFRRFQRDGGAMLAAYATFNALQADIFARTGCFCWRDWPDRLDDAASAEVREFAAEHRADIERHQYLEWEADRQLGQAATQGIAAGLALGLYRDLAVGVDPNGAEAWHAPAMLATEATVGAPPDVLNMKGQDWGLAPINPVMLRRQAYGPFIAALRANMRHAGVLRMDHVMALKHLYWVPRGAGPEVGTYVSYPFQDLLGVVALESLRHDCAVIGEDLGTVPPGFSETLNAHGILSYRVVLFEQDGRGFRPPRAYPRDAAATFATHDLGTLKGFWLGRDLEWRRQLRLYPSDAARENDVEARRRDRRSLLEALIAEGLLTRATAHGLLPDDDAPIYDLTLAEAVHRFVGRTRSSLALVQIEDAVGEEEQANLPGTVDAHPNWRRKLHRLLDDLETDSSFLGVTAAIAAGRAEADAGE